MNKLLVNKTETIVRFSEVDSMAVVWHGNYVKYLEDGREAFGREFNLGYFDVYAHGYMIPIVKLDLNYINRTTYGEKILIETKFINADAAKIMFEYKIIRLSDNQTVLKAKSVQVFLNEKGELEITNPKFFIEWKLKQGII